MIALRGATTVFEDTPEEIRKATLELITTLMKENHLEEKHMVSILFTATKDLHSAYPGKYLREDLDFTEVAMLHFQEMDVFNTLPRCLRVLIHCKGEFTPKHIYLGDAKKLRPDWMES